jgi:hypothetical protein
MHPEENRADRDRAKTEQLPEGMASTVMMAQEDLVRDRRKMAAAVMADVTVTAATVREQEEEHRVRTEAVRQAASISEPLLEKMHLRPRIPGTVRAIIKITRTVTPAEMNGITKTERTRRAERTLRTLPEMRSTPRSLLPLRRWLRRLPASNCLSPLLCRSLPRR